MNVLYMYIRLCTPYYLELAQSLVQIHVHVAFTASSQSHQHCDSGCRVVSAPLWLTSVILVSISSVLIKLYKGLSDISCQILLARILASVSLKCICTCTRTCCTSLEVIILHKHVHVDIHVYIYAHVYMYINVGLLTKQEGSLSILLLR